MKIKNYSWCKGISDEVRSFHNAFLGFIGFHDYDGYIPIAPLRRMVEKLATKLNTSIYLLRTRAGYHLVSFQIQNEKQRKAWIRETLLYFPSDYEPQISVGRILRLSRKFLTERPTLLFAIVIFNNQLWSLGHVRAYIRNKNIPKDAFIFNKMYIPTQVKFCLYATSKKRLEKG